MVLPFKRSANLRSTRQRNRRSTTLTLRIHRPSRWGLSPQQMVSISGNSGISAFRDQQAVAGQGLSEMDKLFDTQRFAPSARVDSFGAKKSFDLRSTAFQSAC